VLTPDHAMHFRSAGVTFDFQSLAGQFRMRLSARPSLAGQLAAASEISISAHDLILFATDSCWFTRAWLPSSRVVSLKRRLTPVERADD
jgi:hypothetical protein